MFTLEVKRFLTKMIVFGIGLVFIVGWVFNYYNQRYLFFSVPEEELYSIWSTIIGYITIAIAFGIVSIALFALYYFVSAMLTITFDEEVDGELFDYKKSYYFLYTLGGNLFERTQNSEISMVISPIAFLLFIVYLVPGNVLFSSYTGVQIVTNEGMSLKQSDRYLIKADQVKSFCYGKDVVLDSFIFKQAGHFEGYRARNEDRPGIFKYIITIPVYFLESIIFTLLFWGVPLIILAKLIDFKQRTSSIRQDNQD